MGDSIDLISTIRELEDMQPELRNIGEYRKANILDFAISYLKKYRAMLRDCRDSGEDREKEETNA
jgi:hypothetical protein